MLSEDKVTPTSSSRPSIIGSIATKGYSDELLNIVFIEEV